MGLFSRKKVNTNKIYTMSEALVILKQPGMEEYTSVDVGAGKYKIITIEQSRELQKRELEIHATRNAFSQRINGQGAYSNIQPLKNYNNYQSAKHYQSKKFETKTIGEI